MVVIKFFKEQYWENINSANRETRKEAEILWHKASKEYADHFDTIKDKLPKAFLQAYQQGDGFHDFTIESLRVLKIEKDVCDLEITLYDGTKKIILLYRKVSELFIDIPKEHDWLAGKMSWGYSELYQDDCKNLEHHILCDISCSIKVRFKKISVLKDPPT